MSIENRRCLSDADLFSWFNEYFLTCVERWGNFSGPQLAVGTLIDIMGERKCKNDFEKLKPEDLSIFKSLLYLLKNPAYRKGTLFALTNSFSLFNEDLQWQILRWVFTEKEEDFSFYLEEVAEEAAIEFLGATPESPYYRQFLEGIWNSLLPEPRKDNQPLLDPPPLTPRSIEAHKVCLLRWCDYLEFFWNSTKYEEKGVVASEEGIVISKINFPDNFLEIVAGFRKMISSISDENLFILYLAKRIFLNLVYYIQEPSRLINLQAYVNQPSGKFLTEAARPLLVIFSVIHQFLEGNVNYLSWSEILQLLDIKKAEEKFPEISTSLRIPLGVPFIACQVEEKGKPYFLMIVTSNNCTKVCIAEMDNDGNALVAAAIEQMKGWLKNTDFSLPYHVHMIINSDTNGSNQAMARSFGDSIIISTSDALKYSNTSLGRIQGHGKHELRDLEIRYQCPRLYLTPFVEEGGLYAEANRPSMDLLEAFQKGKPPPDGFTAIYYPWRDKGAYDLAWLTMAYFFDTLLLYVSPADFWRSLQEVLKN
ncbi:MAG: hypothetical protein ABIK90_03535 [candidate division WOR-3 bacterium]